jgi:MoxR-like ATPase
VSVAGVLFALQKEPLTIELTSLSRLPEEAGSASLPAAVVVREGELASLTEHGEIFKDHRQKHARKELYAAFRGRGRHIPFIRAQYESTGRLKQSVEALLRKAETNRDARIFVLGVQDELFRRILESASPVKSPRGDESPESAIFGLLTLLPGEERIKQEFWGDSDKYRYVRQLILRAARSEDPVLIVGDTGTGKSVVAREIHQLQRPNTPFVVVNCNAIPGDLLESELFGYVPGAFSGANRIKRGLWEMANKGILFLDEVGDLRPDLQGKIFHAIDTKSIRRLGAETEIPVSARIIAATNRDLNMMVQNGQFRKDLLYRLRYFFIPTPELKGDLRTLAVIAQNLWGEITKSEGKLPADVINDLCHHRWPGNVRELDATLRYLNSLFESEPITRAKLNAVFQAQGLLAAYGAESSKANEAALLMVECLKKIRRTDGTLRACEEVLKPLARKSNLTLQIREELERIRVEFRSLLVDRLYFGSQATYAAVARVEELLGQLLALSPRDKPAIATLSRGAVLTNIETATSQLFDEMQRLRALPPVDNHPAVRDTGRS